MFFSSTALCIAAGYEADAHRILLAWATSPISAFLNRGPVALSCAQTNEEPQCPSSIATG